MKTKTANQRTRLRDSEIEELRARLREAEETLTAIRTGAVDALVVRGPQGDQVYALQGAEKAYRLLIEAMNEGALTILRDGTVLYCNQRFSEMVGRPIEKIIGASFYEFLGPDDKERLRHLLDAAKDGGAKEEFVLRGSVQDRSELSVQLSVAHIELDQVSAISVVATDLSERKKQEEILRQLNVALEQRVRERTAELSQANEALAAAEKQLRRDAQFLEEEVTARTRDLQKSLQSMEQFCYTIAHDLRAPLRAMSGFAAALVQDFNAALPPKAQNFANRIDLAAKRMDVLIRDLLAYGRINSAELPMREVDPLPFVEQFINSAKGIQATIEVEGTFPKVHANSTALEQALTNLLSNAVKFARPNTEPLIRVRADNRDGEWVRISVEDNGIGIDPKFHERIFRPFERVCSTDYSGTGIGLAIVQKAVERMGGGLGVESEVGKGSRFWMDLRKARDGSK